MDAHIDEAARVVTAYGAHGRRIRAVLLALTERPRTLAALVRHTAVERRTIEELLDALSADIEHTADGIAVRPELRAAYRERFDDPARAAQPELLAQLRTLIDGAPAPSKALDHVAATAETAAWRGRWLDSTYDLAGARLLCVGDHDLTSLAVALVNPDVAVTVVDLDDRILEYIDTQARTLGLDVRCLFGDLRLGLPASAAASADLVFTDPPYTPAGARLFLARGAEGLRDREHGRLVMAYGYSDRTPALGLKVQQGAQELALVFEAILPGVNRYRGAEAIGSASDLYVCRPTARTWKLLGKVAEATIYTHGPESEEAAGARPGPAVLDAVLERLGAPATIHVGVAWTGVARLGLDKLLGGGLPGAATVKGATHAAVDLSGDRGPLLLRVLLAANADRLAILVPNDHPDVTSEAGQRALAELIGPKYRLRTYRSTPGPAWAIVTAERGAQQADGGGALARRVLERAHGKLGNVWRDGLVAALGCTKNEARAAVRAATERVDCLEAALVEQPRHLVRRLVADVRTSAPPG